MLNIEVNNSDGVLRIALEGRLDNLTAKDLGQRMEPELEGVHRIELDLAKLEYISSAGLRVLLAAQQHMEKIGGDDVCVRNANQMILDTLDMTGFCGVINVE